MVIKRNIILLLLCLSTSYAAYAMNLIMRPYDTLLRAEIKLDACGEPELWAEFGVRPARGFNSDGSIVNPLAIWSSNQDALAMLNGFADANLINNLRNMIDAADDGIRGHLVFDADMQLKLGAVFGGRWYFLPHAWINAFLPYYNISCSDVRFCDLTQSNTAADLRVKNLLTDNLAGIAHQLGGLNLGGWKRHGPGDLNLLVECKFGFPQERPLLTNVDVLGRVGFTLPTGLKADEDRLLAFPFGYDGAVGIVYGGGLDVMLGYYFKAGFDVQLSHLFGNTRDRRVKTARNQTELLLLAKTPAYKDYGLTQRFNLFVQAYQFYKGISFLVGYQFLKHGDDTLALNSCEFSTNIANTARNLEEWIVHEMEFNLHYDGDGIAYGDTWIVPQVSLFARLPFNGKRAITFTTIGFMAAVDF